MPARKVGPKALAAKAKAKKAPGKRRGAAVAEEPEVHVIPTPVADDDPSSAPLKDSKAWNLQRDIDRILKGKLGFVHPVELKSRRNPQGLSVTEALENALQENQAKSGGGGRRQYLTASFWQTFFNDFVFKTQDSTDCERSPRKS